MIVARDLRTIEHRYFFVDKFYETDLKKVTPRAPMGTRIFDLTQVLGMEDIPETEELAKLPANVSEKTINHVVSLYLKYGKNEVFGRTVVEETTGLKSSGASKLIKLLLDNDVIASVKGYGKGKYRFL